MKEEILSEIRPYVFIHTLAKMSSMLDQYRIQLLGNQSQPGEDQILLQDQVDHLLKALTMIAEVSETIDGATMAREIATEAISTIR